MTETKSLSELPCICPKCGQTAVRSEGKYGRRDECCGLWSWKGKPLVDRETHKARILAHEAFDRLWKKGSGRRMNRGQAYRWLQEALGWKECPHMATMSAEDATKVIRLASEKWRGINRG